LHGSGGNAGSVGHCRHVAPVRIGFAPFSGGSHRNTSQHDALLRFRIRHPAAR